MLNLKLTTLELRDEATQRDFIEGLRQLGVPISHNPLAQPLKETDES